MADWTEAEIWDRVDQSLPRPSTSGQRETARREGLVTRALAARTVRERNEAVAALTAAVRLLQGHDLAQRRVRMPAEPHREPTPHETALARIIEARVARHPQVEAFRREVLKGNLLANDPAVVRRWVERLAGEREALAVAEDADRYLDYGARNGEGRALQQPVAIYDLIDTPRSEGRALPPSARKLARLRAVAELLADRLAWDEPDAVHLILTGAAPHPLLHRFRAELVRGPLQNLDSVAGLATPALESIQLTVPVHASPDEVREFFMSVRRLSMGTARPKPLSDRKAALGAFVEEVNDGRTWAQAWSAWNERYSDWAYPSAERFRIEAARAFKRVTGETLIWRREAGHHDRPRSSYRRKKA